MKNYYFKAKYIENIFLTQLLPEHETKLTKKWNMKINKKLHHLEAIYIIIKKCLKIWKCSKNS